LDRTFDFLDDHQRWRRVDENLWTYHTDLGSMGVRPGRRMVAVRRSGHRWTLFSPVPLDRESRAELEGEGQVDALVVPTAFHNTFVPETAAAFPNATVYLVDQAKRHDLEPERCRSIPDDLPATWGEDLVSIPLDGMPRVNEIDFVHPASGTLLVSDLIFHIDGRYPWLTRLVFRLAGARPGIRASRMFRMMVRDRPAFLRSLDRILACDFDRGQEAIQNIRRQFVE
jgi:hypothetical protein